MPAGNRERITLWLAIVVVGVLIAWTYIRPGSLPTRGDDPGLDAVSPTAHAPNLLSVAAGHVELAITSRDESMLWGRIGGSRAEHASARLLAEQLRPFVDEVKTETFQFAAHRPRTWQLESPGAWLLQSAMPAPFDARFRESVPETAIQLIARDEDWPKASGKWAFVMSGMNTSVARTAVRENLLYQRAVEAGAIGFVFSLPTPPGVWRAVVPVDKAFAKPDERYPSGVRPIPCFAIDAEDGQRVIESINQGKGLASAIEYAPNAPLEGRNIVAALKGKGELTVVLAAHLDSFFHGANDDASGIATLVGLAHRLRQIPQSQRNADFLFVGVSAHHDASAGTRHFVDSNPERLAEIDQFILLEHTDAQLGAEGARAGWPAPLNDARDAYFGELGWPELEEAIPDLVDRTNVMTILPHRTNACIADLFVVCGMMKTFCLIQDPPFYHTDHDTMDKISEEGLQASVEFHMRVLETTNAITP